MVGFRSVQALVLALVFSLVSPVGPTAWAAVRTEPADEPGAVRQRIENIPIVHDVRYLGRRFDMPAYLVTVRLPVDHSRPDGATFGLRLQLVHAGYDRPMVVSTSGYQLFPYKQPDELARLVGGNQITVEHRFFGKSRPRDPDWARQLTIRQSARDLHRVIRAFQQIYRRPWLSTGASKGGMTMTYHRRFFPKDVRGTVAKVAPNDVIDDVDVYGDFLADVGGDRLADCRDRLIQVQRRVLGVDREWWVDQLGMSGSTYRAVGGADAALEIATIDLYFEFWQYLGPRACSEIPGPTATRSDIAEFTKSVLPLDAYSDQFIRRFVPYFYQAARELGSPEPWQEPLADLIRHPGLDLGETMVPPRLRPVRFRPGAMADIDDFVRHRARRMLFVYGEYDPWSAEPFACGAGGAKRECSVMVDPGGNHGASIRSLPARLERRAIRQVRRWAGLATTSERLRGLMAELATMRERDPQGREGLP